MRKIRDVLRLNAEGLSNRKIAVSLGIGRTTIGDTARRAQLAGLNWPFRKSTGLVETRSRKRFDGKIMPHSH